MDDFTSFNHNAQSQHTPYYMRILACHTRPPPQGNNVNNIVDKFLKKKLHRKKNVVYLQHVAT